MLVKIVQFNVSSGCFSYPSSQKLSWPVFWPLQNRTFVQDSKAHPWIGFVSGRFLSSLCLLQYADNHDPTKELVGQSGPRRWLASFEKCLCSASVSVCMWVSVRRWVWVWLWVSMCVWVQVGLWVCGGRLPRFWFEFLWDRSSAWANDSLYTYIRDVRLRSGHMEYKFGIGLFGIWSRNWHSWDAGLEFAQCLRDSSLGHFGMSARLQVTNLSGSMLFAGSQMYSLGTCLAFRGSQVSNRGSLPIYWKSQFSNHIEQHAAFSISEWLCLHLLCRRRPKSRLVPNHRLMTISTFKFSLKFDILLHNCASK